MLQGKSHYSLGYLGKGRLFSIAHQLDALLLLKPQSVLEVGVGAGITAASLRACGIDVTTLDIQPELNPDLLAPVTKIPLADASIDAALCCQVLEHLPYSEFPAAARELRRVTRQGMILSLPDVTPHFDFAIALPGLRRKRISYSPQFWTKRPRLDKMKHLGHHWEIGYRGTPLNRVRRDLEQCGWTIARSWRVPEKPWHRFFLLKTTEN